MIEKVEKGVQILFLLLGLSHRKIIGKVLSFAFFTFQIFLFSFVIEFTAQQLPEKNLREMFKGYVNPFVFCTICATSVIIYFQAWIGQKLEIEIEDTLKKFDEILSDDCVEKSRKKKQFLDAFHDFLSTVKKLLPLVISLFLCLEAEFHGDVETLWDVLTYPIVIMKFAFFQYVLMVGKVHKRFRIMNQQLEKFSKRKENFERPRHGPRNVFRISKEFRPIPREIEETIIKMIRSQNVLSSSITFLNTRFGFSILLIVFSSFMTITHCGYSLFIELETTRDDHIIVGEYNQNS
jgi:hypothetical protein